jgi:hypothetical protein
MKLNTDRIVSLSAMAVGIGSLFIIVYQTHLIRESQHASVLPYLMVAINSNDSGIHVTLSNAGIGPALIEDVRVLFQGRQLEATLTISMSRVDPVPTVLFPSTKSCRED